ncbi:Phage protein [Vibrio crassostreae]|nr:Phage protein [Vibrio crassostreae]
MGIKNWTITAEGAQSAMSREVYFHNKKDKNHKHTIGYLDVFGNAEHTLNIIRNTERHKLKTARKQKGGRPPLEGSEFVLTFPKGIRPTTNQWKEMLAKVMLDVAHSVGVKRTELAPICRAVAHQQDEKIEGGTGDHLHVLIGRFTNDGKYLRKLQSKSTLYRMKQSFNVAALEVMGVNHATYEPVKTYKGVAKKRVPKWKVEAGREWDKLREANAKIQNNHKIVQDNKKQIELENEKLAEQERALDKFFKQADRWLEAFANEDSKQMNRQHNRLKKSLEELDAFRFDESLDRATNKVINEIESKSNKPLRDTRPKTSRLKF